MREFLKKCLHKVTGCPIQGCEVSNGFGSTSSSNRGSVWLLCDCGKAYPIWDLGTNKPHK